VLEDAGLGPALEPAMHAGVVAEAFRKLVPLATGPHLEDDAVQARPPADVLAAGFFRGPERLEDRADQVPEFVVEFPDRVQRRRVESPFALSLP
jgi:hypothetical protein